MRYSWVLPVYNESRSLIALIGEIKGVMKKSSDWEIVAVDDSSTDKTSETLDLLKRKMPQLRLIKRSYHQGKWSALREGIKESRGEIIITLDSDLQDDPKEAVKLLKKIESGYDLVSGWRKRRNDPFYKVVISQIGNWLVSILTNKKFRDLNSPMKVYRKEVIRALPQEGSLFRFSLLFAYKMGFKTIEIPILHRRRMYGKSKFGVKKYIRIIYDLVLILLLFSGSGRLKRIKS